MKKIFIVALLFSCAMHAMHHESDHTQSLLSAVKRKQKTAIRISLPKADLNAPVQDGKTVPMHAIEALIKEHEKPYWLSPATTAKCAAAWGSLLFGGSALAGKLPNGYFKSTVAVAAPVTALPFAGLTLLRCTGHVMEGFWRNHHEEERWKIAQQIVYDPHVRPQYRPGDGQTLLEFISGCQEQYGHNRGLRNRLAELATTLQKKK